MGSVAVGFGDETTARGPQRVGGGIERICAHGQQVLPADNQRRASPPAAVSPRPALDVAARIG